MSFSISVIWSFIGYSNANYAMSEMKNPIRTIKRAGPIAMFSVTIVYMLVWVWLYRVWKSSTLTEVFVTETSRISLQCRRTISWAAVELLRKSHILYPHSGLISI